MSILTSALDSLFIVRDILHTNIASGNDPNATTQQVRISTQIAGGKATGLRVSPPEIYMNDELTSSIHGYQSKFAYDQTLFDKLKQLDPILGQVNSPSSFSALFARYESALSNFAAQPDNQGLRGNLVNVAQE
jgi:flagellar hook-associated protein FlgK